MGWVTVPTVAGASCGSINVVVTTDPAGARKFNKDKSRERIDGMVALAMAVGLRARETQERVIEFEGSLVLSGTALKWSRRAQQIPDAVLQPFSGYANLRT